MKRLARYGVKQAKKCRLLMQGLPLSTPSYAGMTFDLEDVECARKWLKRRETWGDADVVRSFEREFADWNGSTHAWAFMGGRVALSACLDALDLASGAEIVVPGYTCVVVPNAIRFAGLRPVYCDIELDTYGVDIDSLRSCVTSRTKAVILQHLYGLVCRDYLKIVEFTRSRNIALIEDCAHATGAYFQNRRVGNLGDLSFISMEHSKVLSTEMGGVAITNREDLSDRIREYQHHSAIPSFDRIENILHTLILDYYQLKHPQRWLIGDAYGLLHEHKRVISTTRQEERGERPDYYRQQLPAPLAAIGRIQLAKIDVHNQMRRENAQRWDAWCDQHGYKKPVVIPESTPVFLRYPVLVDPRLKYDTRWFLKNLGVRQGLWFRSHLHPVDTPVEGCPNAARAVAGCVNLPTLML